MSVLVGLRWRALAVWVNGLGGRRSNLVRAGEGDAHSDALGFQGDGQFVR